MQQHDESHRFSEIHLCEVKEARHKSTRCDYFYKLQKQATLSNIYRSHHTSSVRVGGCMRGTLMSMFYILIRVTAIEMALS